MGSNKRCGTAFYFLKLIEGAQLYVDNLGTRPDPALFERVRQVLGQAQAELHRRLARHPH